MKIFAKWVTCLLVTSLLILDPVMNPYVTANAATTSAQRKASTKITVAYDANGGTGAPGRHMATVKGGITSYKLSTVVPSRAGYKFIGWRLENDRAYDIDRPGQSIVIEVGQSETLVYYAQWEKVAENIQNTTYTITYVLNGGKNHANNPASYTKLSGVTLYNPNRSGYTFGGWYSDSSFKTKVTGIAKGSTGNKTFYAKWNTITYTITYKLNGGTNHAKNPSSYTVLSGVTLYNPSRSGYTFGGWYTDGSFKIKTTGFPAGMIGNRTFYAKWNKNPSTGSTDTGASVNYGTSEKNAKNAGITYYTQGKGYNKFWNGKVWIGSNGTNYAYKSSVSCGICCDAMIASYFGAKLTPGALLQANKSSASWDGSGVKNLMKKNGLTSNSITTSKSAISQKEKKAKLDDCLKKYKNDPKHNGPPMVSIYNKGAGSNHFVLVVGKDKSGNYIIIDPANNERATLIVTEGNTGQGNKTGYKSCIKGIFTWTKK